MFMQFNLKSISLVTLEVKINRLERVALAMLVYA